MTIISARHSSLEVSEHGAHNTLATTLIESAKYAQKQMFVFRESGLCELAGNDIGSIQAQFIDSGKISHVGHALACFVVGLRALGHANSQGKLLLAHTHA